ncbi:hypothetical protein C8F04DRAFT_1037671 [Mycena alexandri]|uniref:Uncharacterized protein n=1 Tax=Mycena alexandri TaxID=1745969 RepID=A0AAD6X180_9AGAR|nr:hypothetical protein C8F04DRAFT_1037671 [Mycena alexandri]
MSIMLTIKWTGHSSPFPPPRNNFSAALQPAIYFRLSYKLQQNPALLLSKVSFAGAALVPRAAGDICDGQVTLSEAFIGPDKNVRVQYATCPKYGSKVKTLEARQAPIDVCGNSCATSCFTPSGGGPNPNDCAVIADALLYDSQNIGPLFTVGTGTNNTVVMQYATCLTFFVNQDTVPIEYCRDDWSSLVKFIAPNCQATQNAHGGFCLASNEQWFAQVNHS